MLRDIVHDLVCSARDALAYAFFTVFMAWLYAPEGLLG